MKKQIVKSVLGSLCGASLIFGLAACGAKGDKGEKGDKGDQGIQGSKGDKGDTGKGIAKVEYNEKNELIITYTDGTTINLGVIKGDKGDKGDTGEKGDNATDAYSIAKSFGYIGSYGDWLNDIIRGDLGVQYAVTLNDDYTSFTYGWDNKLVNLGQKAILLDSRLTDEEVSSHSYIYNDINAAIAAATDGTEEEQMVIYMAPGVYWTHDPDSSSTDQAFTIQKNCANMKWQGLTDDYRNVVIAFNYGHNVGYDGGNPTCFNISGDGFQIENLTVGGYCNIDLDYALNTSLNHEKRSTDVTQCQLGSYSGDKLYCRNVAFISRLNMMPFVSNARALYVDCHMESTDDSLNGSSKAVYLNCDFDFYASKPWGGSSGVTLLNCDFNITHINVGIDPHQYLVKGAGRFNVIDSRFHDSTGSQTYKIGWCDILSDTYRSYYSNVSYNGVQIDFSDGGINKDKGIDISGTQALKAYKLVNSKGNVTYNVYNLLRGNDDWDPLGQKALVTSLGGLDVPTNLALTTTSSNLETGSANASTAKLEYTISGPQNTDYNANANVSWSVDEAHKGLVSLAPQADGSCIVTATNEQEEAVDVIITARDQSGLAAAIKINVKPSILPIDKASNLQIIQNTDGTAKVSYDINNLGVRADNSRINWYVCDDVNGTNPIHVATGRGTSPLKSIVIHPAWVGKYLKATVESKHIRSDYAEAVSVLSDAPISNDGVMSFNEYEVNLEAFATDNNMTILPGYWIVNNASYGTGAKNGFKGYTGLYFNGSKSTSVPFSEIDYTPVDGTYGDMRLTMKVAPGKTAAQGFGSKGNFIEVRIKYDAQTKTGYAVRIERESGDSTIVKLVKLSLDAEGKQVVTVLAQSQSTSVYLTECTINVWTQDGKLYTHIETSAEQPKTAVDKGYLASVDLEAEITANTNGGFGIYYESSTGDNTSYIGSLKVEWKK